MPLINTTGRHEVTAKTGTFGESKNGTPFIEISFSDDSGATINGWLYLSEKAFENSLKTLRDAFGFNGNFETLPAQIEGKRCSITTEEEADDKGVLRLKVKWINALRVVIPLKDGGALKKFTAMAARIPNVDRPKAATNAPKAAPAAKAMPSNPQNFGDFPQ